MMHPEGGKVGSYELDVNGISVGILDCTFNDAHRGMTLMPEIFRKAREMEAKQTDVRICYVHWNYFVNNAVAFDERMRATAKFLANMGMDYIVGSGPRSVMGFEIMEGNYYRRTPVAYSLGNLLTCASQLNRNAAAVIQLKIRKDARGKVTISDSYLPCYTWPVLSEKRRRVQYLNDRKYQNEKTGEAVEWRKAFIAERLGGAIPLCHDFDIVKDKSEEKPEPPEWLADNYDRERLADAGELQKMVLDSYRLTDEFKEKYGELLFSNDKYSPVIEGAVHYLRMHCPELLESDEAREVIVDMIYCQDVLSFSYAEYFGFRLRDKSLKERMEFISERYRLHYYRNIKTADYKEENTLDNKWTCYLRMKDLFKREIVNVTDRGKKEEFLRFAESHDRFMIKPVNGSLGIGIRIISREEYDDAEELFESTYAKAGPFVCEELIVSKEYVSALHPQSVNTVRVLAYNNNGNVKIVYTFIRIGVGDSIVDNAGAGGVFAAINKKTGIIEVDAADKTGALYEVHPDTGVRFKGFKFEDWDEMKELVAEASNRFPAVKLIAWDLAHGEKGWQIVEGNAQGQMWVYQGSTGMGMRKRMERVIRWQGSKRKKK